MKLRLSKSPARGLRQRAFSLLEMMVAVGLLTIVILALYAMFDQTQRALRSNVAQTDVSEAGRAALELIVRDLEQAQASGLPGVTNNIVVRRTYPDTRMAEFQDGYSRDTTLHELFFLTRPDLKRGSARALFVAHENNSLQRVDDYVGTLYRYELPEANRVSLRGPMAATNLNQLWLDFSNPSFPGRDLNNTNYNRVSRILDGVVFFRVLPYGHNGQPLDATTHRNDLPADVSRPITIGPGADNVTTFGNAALPAALEVEFGMLPPRLLSQFRALPNPCL
jgi:prepilin-type N-terminal cleavage/methylation domain-containing protein